MNVDNSGILYKRFLADSWVISVLANHCLALRAPRREKEHEAPMLRSADFQTRETKHDLTPR